MSVASANVSRVSGLLAASGAELARLTDATLLHDGAAPIRGAAVDSRRIAERRGALFVALPGVQTDGRLHLLHAIEQGANALLIEEGGDRAAQEHLQLALSAAAERGVSILSVPSGVAALSQLASAWRARFDVETIGVTGSVGKTTTKEAIYSALGGERDRVAATPGNANNEIGLPLALLNLPDATERFVAEMGMYVGGEISALCAMARPRIGVVTAIDAVHAERAGGLDAIESAKGELIAALPADGWAILAADDARVMRLAARGPARVLTAGHAEGADVHIVSVELDQETARTRVELRVDEERLQIDLPLFGAQFARSAGLAIAVAKVCGVDLRAAASRLSEVQLPNGRASVRNIGGVRLIDDAYNAAPSSMAAALVTLSSATGARFAALGAMGELGEYAAAAHEEIGRAAAESGLTMLLVFGTEADGIAAGARSAGMPVDQIVRLSADEQGIIAGAGLIADRVRTGDTVLIKASRSVALERLVAALDERLSGGHA
ncbi:MAG: UDP-N-acetylmuramoyl-tripeptide--D-alanyl-D-alanine ligase [Candidatus Limnocylindrus sp. ZSMar2m-chloro-G89]|nr:MAG: UDP-N-acetylmuramoyl-tripeptide--D-alanyl-D-alanine ligase [Candidatus Limnocylindrus sp.]RLT49653.1 MAG: UDP-N-acetylmuramoyl-tripeptide--D-alanyl-D-alanine ligase [Candidatus Limnocylindrus sp. ZSMar2m-chloro-G89]